MLEAYAWNFARRQKQLAASATPPLFTYAKSYPVPQGFIRLYMLPDAPQQKWEVMEGHILTDAASGSGALNVVYIHDIEDPTKFSPLFVAALGHAIGEALAQPIAQSLAKEEKCRRVVEGKLAIARTINSQANSPEEFDADVLLGSRG